MPESPDPRVAALRAFGHEEDAAELERLLAQETPGEPSREAEQPQRATPEQDTQRQAEGLRDQLNRSITPWHSGGAL